MLITPYHLSKSIADLTKRNDLIQELLATPLNDSADSTLKWVLAAWLGSNVTLSMETFSTRIAPYASYVDYGYFVCFLLNRFALNKGAPPVGRMIAHQTLDKILHYYNHHAQQLIYSPKTLFIEFLKIVLQGQAELTRVDFKIKKTLSYCLQVLSNAIRADSVNIRIKPNKEFIKLIEKSGYSLTNYIPIQLNRFVSCAAQHPKFEEIFADQSSTFQLRKILLPNQDGQVIDGLYIEPKDSTSLEVVIALIGHFPVEAHYMARSLMIFYDAFKVPMLFLNHTNFSVYSTQYAKYLDTLVRDCLSFVNYFRAQEKNIVLYGMCGGTATIIQTAHSLMQQKIPFKLIVDRASQSYRDWLRFKTVWHLINMEPGWLTLCLFILHCLIVITGMNYIMIKISKNNIDFGKLLKQIPQEDVLILQAKTSKKDPYGSSDLLVAPDNDLRQIYKKERHEQRNVLKKLKKLSLDIAKEVAVFSDQNLDIVFLQLANCFDCALQLIDNEKLQLKYGVYQLTDTHSATLNMLETRHKLGLTRLFHGFFKRPNSPCFLHLPKMLYTQGTIMLAVEHFFPPITPLRETDNRRLTNNLMDFFSYLFRHRNYLTYMGTRVSMSGMNNLGRRLHELFQTPLVSTIEETNNKLWEGFDTSSKCS